MARQRVNTPVLSQRDHLDGLWLSLKEAAAMIGRAQFTVRQYVNVGRCGLKLPHQRTGGRIIIHEVDLREWLAAVAERQVVVERQAKEASC